jgi:hypothetical protein
MAGRRRKTDTRPCSRRQQPVDKLLAEVTPMLGYLSGLSARIDTRGMGTEPLAGSVRKAQTAMQALRMALHFLHYVGLGERANSR